MSNCRAKNRVYYNINIAHDEITNPNGEPTPARFSESRDEPLFDGLPCNYNMSVVRFTVPTSYIPIQYFPVEYDASNPTNPNKSIYSITLSYNGVDYQEFLEWRTQQEHVPIPPAPSPTTTGRTTQRNPDYLLYYSLYSFNHLTTLINEAIARAFNNNILPLLPPPPDPLTQNYRPAYFTYDGATRLFTLHAQFTFINDQFAANPILLYMNTFLNENFDTSFDVVYEDYTAINGKNVKFNILDRGYPFRQIDPTSPDGFIYPQLQEFDSTGQMSTFQNILFRSVSMPINFEAVSQVQNATGQNGLIASSTDVIITDFEIDLGTEQNLKSFIHYVPTAEYRRITMRGHTPIQRIDLDILWKDTYGNTYPVLIPPHKNATAKILFEEN
jgi:hypothetical protein